MDKEPGCLPWAAALLTGAVVGVLIGAWVGETSGRSYERRKAVEAGVACWEVDPKTGRTEFKYGKE